MGVEPCACVREVVVVAGEVGEQGMGVAACACGKEVVARVGGAGGQGAVVVVVEVVRVRVVVVILLREVARRRVRGAGQHWVRLTQQPI